MLKAFVTQAPNHNKEHALIFLGRVDEARAIYLRYRGKQKVSGDKPWGTVILKDFAELRKAGLTPPLMDEIEKALSARGRNQPDSELFTH